MRPPDYKRGPAILDAVSQIIILLGLICLLWCRP